MHELYDMLTRVSIRNIFTEIVAALLVLLFLYTAISKLAERDSFVSAMKHNITVARYAVPLSWLIPLIELVIVFLLFVPLYRRRGLLYSTVLMGLFTAYVGYMLLTQSSLPCTCGGILEQMTWRSHFWFNLITTITSLAAFLFYPKILSRPTGEAEHLRHSRQH